jgi:DNA/RNA endonuclease YhcR with UshA esterase domain
MSLRDTLRRAIESHSEIEAAEERAEAKLTAGCVPVEEVHDRERVSVSGVLRSVTLRPREGVPALEAELYDGSGTLDLVWLGRRAIAGIVPGRRLRVDGFVCEIAGRRAIFNPRYELRPRSGE